MADEKGDKSDKRGKKRRNDLGVAAETAQM